VAPSRSTALVHHKTRLAKQRSLPWPQLVPLNGFSAYLVFVCINSFGEGICERSPLGGLSVSHPSVYRKPPQNEPFGNWARGRLCVAITLPRAALLTLYSSVPMCFFVNLDAIPLTFLSGREHFVEIVNSGTTRKWLDALKSIPLRYASAWADKFSRDASSSMRLTWVWGCLHENPPLLSVSVS
jgi:hypothetical protein